MNALKVFYVCSALWQEEIDITVGEVQRYLKERFGIEMAWTSISFSLEELEKNKFLKHTRINRRGKRYIPNYLIYKREVNID